MSEGHTRQINGGMPTTGFIEDANRCMFFYNNVVHRSFGFLVILSNHKKVSVILLLTYNSVDPTIEIIESSTKTQLCTSCGCIFIC